MTDNEKRKEYTGDSLIRQDVSPAFFCEFSKGMECASRNLKNSNNPIPTLFLYGKKIRYPVLEKASERYTKYTKKTIRIRRSEVFPEPMISCMTPDAKPCLKKLRIL